MLAFTCILSLTGATRTIFTVNIGGIDVDSAKFLDLSLLDALEELVHHSIAHFVKHVCGYNDRDYVRIPVTIWLGLSAVTNVSITVILIYALRRIKTNFRGTKNMIKQLTTLSIQTGTPGSVVATIALIIYLNDTESNISVGVAFSLGRVYALTMLHNLNSRAYGSHTIQRAEGINMHLPMGETFLRGLQTENLSDVRNEGIHVHRTAVVQIDEQLEKSMPLDHVESLPTDREDYIFQKVPTWPMSVRVAAVLIGNFERMAVDLVLSFSTLFEVCAGLSLIALRDSSWTTQTKERNVSILSTFFSPICSEPFSFAGHTF
ncbi:hypothetical protein MPER_12555 [Moniliophthora perniciosa FA553]|nr:hypothetical protein MPER_12555 [Moniliophthora perniciosa FA553]